MPNKIKLKFKDIREQHLAHQQTKLVLIIVETSLETIIPSSHF